ncbi:MAG: asparaginase [Clostridium sp.]|nr:asparaginase [Clostridium sp.]
MQKILVIGTGGTIASVRESNIHLDNPFKILEGMNYADIEFECVSPFSILSENMSFARWEELIAFIKGLDFDKYLGVILLHGSDTLAYTGALLGNIFCDKPIVLVASNLPPEDINSNGAVNFMNAVAFLEQKPKGVYISYDTILPAVRTESANSQDEFILSGVGAQRIIDPVFTPKNILIIHPYVNIDYNNYRLDGVDAVLHTMYHSATCPENVKTFMNVCKSKSIPFYFVTAKDRAEYESAEDFDSIIFNSTLENAYAKLLLTK